MYEAWRISYQSSEQAARAAWEEMTRLHQRQPLTDAEIQQIGISTPIFEHGSLLRFARAIERAHGIPEPLAAAPATKEST